MNSRSPKMPANLPSGSTAGRAGRPLSTTLRAAGPTGSSALSGSISWSVALAYVSGIALASFPLTLLRSQQDVADRDVRGRDRQRDHGHGEADLEERQEPDRPAGPRGQPRGGDVGRRGDDRPVPPEARPQR